MKNTKIKSITKIAVVAALYVSISALIPSILTAGPLQIRPAEGLNNLALISKKYILALTLGVVIYNIFFSPLWIDWFVGTFHTLIITSLIYATRNVFKKSIYKYLLAAFIASSMMWIIALELKFLGFTDQSFWYVYLGLAVSEMISMLIGSLIMNVIIKKDSLIFS